MNIHLKTYWRGKTIFIDKTEKENQVNVFRFYLRFFQVLFALLGVNTFISLFLVRPASGTTLPYVLGDTGYTKERKLLAEFYEHLSKDDGYSVYGLNVDIMLNQIKYVT